LNKLNKQTVEQFLRDFKVKLKVFDVVYGDREKNTQALLDLEILPSYRRTILENLEIEDYCDGPLEETMLGSSEMWVFGKQISGQDVYIKITMGLASQPVICISFHIAEHTLTYPFK